MTDKPLALGWNHGLLSVDRFGGRLGPVLFLLPDGRQVAPLAVASWFSEDIDLSHQPLFHRLRGEWPCVPFGFERDRPSAYDWPASSAKQAIDSGHGFSASHDWEVLEASDECIKLAITYPADHPIARLERMIRPVPDRPAIDLHLHVEARADCRLPLGLHPTLAAPVGAGHWFIDLSPDTIVATCPYKPTPNSTVAPGRFAPIAAVPTLEGKSVDARYFPPGFPTEELLQVLEVKGRVDLVNSSENYRLTLAWDPDHFPSLVLWISHRGLTNPPWNARFSALGVEPICSAFDLGTAVSQAENPISRRGIRTAHAFRAGETFSTRYRLAAELI